MAVIGGQAGGTDAISLRVVTAPNPGPMTFQGTQSYVLGSERGDVAVIDPGPDDAGHLAALAAAVADRPVVAVLVTHAHRDHTAGAGRFARRVNAPVLAHGGAAPARRSRETRLRPGSGGGEGMDLAFVPDRRIGDGEVIAGDGWSLEAIATPGHSADHLCFAWREARAVFTGDVIMSWSSTLISPPDGDVASFRISLGRLAQLEAEVFYPGHGDPVRDPAARIADQLAHRAAREAQILAVLTRGPATVAAIVAAVYVDVPIALHPAAERNVLAHLLDLIERGRVRSAPKIGGQTRFEVA